MAETEIVRVVPSAAQLARPLDFTPEQRQMIRDTFANGASDSEFMVLMEIAKARNLNPLLRQVFFVTRWDSQKRREVWSVQVSIDGLRAIAERTGRYEGQTPAQWCGEDGAWTDVWLKKTPPLAARVGVYRAGFRDAVYAVAKWDSYAQTKKDGGITHMWTKFPDLMLAKCAEALALRKAFPEDTAGLYTDDEMAQADKPAPEAKRSLSEKVDDKVASIVAAAEKEAPTAALSGDGAFVFTFGPFKDSPITGVPTEYIEEVRAQVTSRLEKGSAKDKLAAKQFIAIANAELASRVLSDASEE